MSTLKEYIVKVTEWKERLENLLDKRPRYKSLETWSHWLVEYQLNKLEEVVMPGSWAEVGFYFDYGQTVTNLLAAQGQQGSDGQYPALLFED